MTNWVAADWPAPAGIRAGTTLRTGGASDGPYASLNLGDHVNDQPLFVTENRRRLQHECELPAPPQWLHQVHGSTVVALPNSFEHPEADAAITTERGVVCAVLTADCLPVLFASKDGSAIGAAHAGWRGLLDGVLEATVDKLPAQSGILAWLGPAISQKAFEVGAEVRDAFVARSPEAAPFFERNARGRWQADLYGLARHRLAGIGITDVYGGNRCTYTESNAFFSYRRDGQCGRMASFVFRAE
ncbi:MAG: peptidoglycan editing factor PgeF [Woeseia sp.]